MSDIVLKRRQRCEKCESWKRSTGLGVKLPNKTPHMGVCSNEKWVYGDDDIHDGVSYEDYESYQAFFKTGEDFGCVHYKKRA